ncbi:imidazoleglycerol-phosphate dehydratase HisB [Candidatus Vidania fulgoroideorum]
MKEIFKIKRFTSETKIKIKIDFSKKVNLNKISTGICFFDHLIKQLSFHGNFYIKIKAKGDLDVDNHHLVEDVGICLGKIFKKIFKKRIINRYSFNYVPMDESLTRIVIDVCNRPNFIFKCSMKGSLNNGFSMLNVYEFFKSFSNNSLITIHLKNYGKDTHHRIESIFKCLGLSLGNILKLKRNFKISTK